MSEWVSLLSDFGASDWYVGAMKSVLAREAPESRIIDLCHGVPPGAVASGAFVLGCNWERFPAGTVHLAVVDPGVGSARRAVAAGAGGHFFVAPDNGLLEAVRGRADFVAVELERQAMEAPGVSPTFHGRDVFAPAAARLARGEALADLGPPAGELSPGKPGWERDGRGWKAAILWIDGFGNLITDLPMRELEGRGLELQITAGRLRIHGLRRTFSDVRTGEGVAYGGSCATLELALRDGNAARASGLELGAEIQLRPE